MKERILLTRQEYSVLKERNEGDECGWSDCPAVAPHRYLHRCLPSLPNATGEMRMGEGQQERRERGI
jgi:hypothetical protein